MYQTHYKDKSNLHPELWEWDGKMTKGGLNIEKLSKVTKASWDGSEEGGSAFACHAENLQRR